MTLSHYPLQQKLTLRRNLLCLWNKRSFPFYDGLVKSPIQPIIVIPVKTGIQ